MSQYEALSIFISCLAALLSLSSWVGQRRLQREANDLQRATSKLAEKQLEIILREERGKLSARISLEIFKDGKTYRFRIKNVGEVDAKDVELKMIVNRPEDNPVIKSEYDEKFPAKRMTPGSSITLIAAIHLSSPTAFNAALSWTNPTGERIEEETYVAL